MGIGLLPDFLLQNYEVHEWKHACAILLQDFPEEWDDMVAVLAEFRFHRSWITVGGGRKSKVSEAIDSSLYSRGWAEKQFATEIVIDGSHTETPTHQIDCFKNRIALEIEWNNKDPFFRSRPKQFPPAVRTEGGLGRCNHHALRQSSGDLPQDRPWKELWCFHDAHGQIAAASGGRWRGWLPDPRVRHQPIPLR
jgi:hypothetical protein